MRALVHCSRASGGPRLPYRQTTRTFSWRSALQFQVNRRSLKHGVVDMTRRLVLAMLLLLGLAPHAIAQQRRTITGRITDETSGRPISGAQILVKGTNT